jgi:hypothetical protein
MLMVRCDTVLLEISFNGNTCTTIRIVGRIKKKQVKLGRFRITHDDDDDDYPI